MKTTKEYAEAIITEIEKNIPKYLARPDDSHSNGNVSVCIIDSYGNIFGKMYGTDKIRCRATYKIAWLKASQVWITGMKTGEFEKKVFNQELHEEDFGIQAPDFIGWPGGQPIVLKNNTILSIGFSGFTGVSDLKIVAEAVKSLSI